MKRVEREVWGVGFKLLGGVLLLAVGWWIFTWPWMLATNSAVANGHPQGSTEYTMAGWTAELIYLAALGALVVLVVVWARSRTKRPGWRHKPGDPPGLKRRWDGVEWTTDVQWEFNAVRPDGQNFTHGSCTIKHRTSGAATRCTSRI